MIVLNTIIFAYSLFALCETALVDTLQKCSITDDECLRLLYQNTLQKYAKTGILELNMTPMDPFEMKIFTVKVLDTVTVTMYDAIVSGVGTCVFNSFHLNLDERFGSQTVTCTLIAAGKISISGTNPALQSVFGVTSIDANGEGKLTFEEIRFKYDAPFNLHKNDHGEIYLTIESKGVKYTEDAMLKNASMTSKNVFFGNNDMSQLVSSYFNDNWSSIMKTFGNTFLSQSGEMYFFLINKFFSGVSTKYYIIEDLSPYVK